MAQHCFTNHVFKDHFPCIVAETVRVCNNAILDELFNIRITGLFMLFENKSVYDRILYIKWFSWKLAIILEK